MTRATFGRRTLLRAGGLAVVGATAGTPTHEATPDDGDAVPADRFADDLTGVADGPLDGRVAPTGHRWRALGVPAPDPPVVLGGAFGPPAGHVPGGATTPADDGLAAAAGYASVELGGPVSRVDVALRWDASRTTSSGLAFGAFDFLPGAVDPSFAGGSSAHVGITPGWVQFSVFSHGVRGDYRTLVPRGGGSTTTALRDPHRCDGRTIHRASVTISGSTARVEVDGLAAPLEFSDARIASVRATTAFWEYYSVPGGTNLPRFVRVSARRA